MARSGAIFTAEGVKKISALQGKVNALPVFSPPKGSDYSDKMRKIILDIATNLIARNDKISAWNEDAINKLKEQMDFLDDGKGTQVPDIFNEETYQLALLIKEFTDSLNFETDLTAQARALVTPLVGDFDKFFAILKKNLEFKIHFYALLKSQMEKDELKRSLLAKMNELDEKFKNDIGVIDFRFDAFNATYEKEIQAIVESAEAIPYSRVSNTKEFVDQAAPYVVTKDERPLSFRSDILKSLIALEEEFNKELAEKGISQKLTFVYNMFSRQFSEEELMSKDEEFKRLVEAFRSDVEKYKKGDHLKVVGVSTFFNMFKSVDKEKIALLDMALIQIQLQAEQFSGWRAKQGTKYELVSADKLIQVDLVKSSFGLADSGKIYCSVKEEGLHYQLNDLSGRLVGYCIPWEQLGKSFPKNIDEILSPAKKGNCLFKIKEITDNIGHTRFKPLIARIFDTAIILIDAGKKNANISDRKKIALGEVSKLVNRYALDFLALSFSLDARHDHRIALDIEAYERALGITQEKMSSAAPTPSSFGSM